MRFLELKVYTNPSWFELAAKSYHGVPLSKAFSGLSKAQYVNALTKEGASALKFVKTSGWIFGGVAAGISIGQAVNFYEHGGKGSAVLVKTCFDVGMIAAGLVGGPIGLAVSISYFVADLTTDGFHVSYDIKP